MVKLGVFYCVENNLEKDVNSLKSFLLGAVYKIIKPDYVNIILQELKNLTA